MRIMAIIIIILCVLRQIVECALIRLWYTRARSVHNYTIRTFNLSVAHTSAPDRLGCTTSDACPRVCVYVRVRVRYVSIKCAERYIRLSIGDDDDDAIHTHTHRVNEMHFSIGRYDRKL